uniref:Leucine carboxyl methyltransferase 1 n=1 Tax=Cuerna arida TaxID=1464854 RepID=A0A1B6GTW1_9HEMI
MTLQIEGTNDSSCMSKLSSVSTGYFNDEFLCHFVQKCPRRAPLIHLGYSVRAAIINALVDKFVSHCTSLKQIVSLGAGFDTLYFKLRKKNPNISIAYFELDLPRVVKKKILCIQRSKVLSHYVEQFVESDDGLLSEQYRLLATDLRDTEAVRKLLYKHGLDWNLPTLFLSECAITYLEEERSTRLIKLASEFENATFVTYEQIHPDDGFGLVMVRHFAALQSPLMSVRLYPSLDHQKQRIGNTAQALQPWKHTMI